MNKLPKVKKALVLENGLFSEMEGQTIDGFVKQLQKSGVEVVIIERASHRKKEILLHLPTTDLITFASTFIYESDVKGIGDLLKDYPKSFLVYGYVIGDTSLEYHLSDIWNIYEMKELAKHKVYEIGGDRIELEFEEIDMQKYVRKWEEEEKERMERNKGFRKTGRKVKVLDVKAQGLEFNHLTPGTILDELDCTSIDPNPSRGTWVMGATEPVKLLNNDRMEEWEYEKPKGGDLAREFFSMGSILHEKDLMEVVESWIKRSLPEYNHSEVWEWCDNLCRTLGLERRFYRHYFERRLREYQSKHTYFKES